MINSQAETNRRRETRYRTLTGQRMNWHPADTIGAYRKGWVLDISQSGLGMMVEDDKVPEIGDEILVKVQASADPLSYEVVRIDNESSRIAVIGCERVYGRVTRLDLPHSEPTDHMSRAA